MNGPLYFKPIQSQSVQCSSLIQLMKTVVIGKVNVVSTWFSSNQSSDMEHKARKVNSIIDNAVSCVYKNKHWFPAS